MLITACPNGLSGSGAGPKSPTWSPLVILPAATENALYKICKNFKPKNKNLKYLITDTSGKILKNSYDLKILLKNTNWKKLQK